MNNKLKNRYKSFLWRAGMFALLSGFTYLADISDVREIEGHKVVTLLMTGFCAAAASEVTKWINTSK